MGFFRYFDLMYRSLPIMKLASHNVYAYYVYIRILFTFFCDCLNAFDHMNVYTTKAIWSNAFFNYLWKWSKMDKLNTF
jgi:hypothetical protein